ncbi:MAG: FIST C-terminal domain-containing protein [Synergistaceae bacterium]|jgi:hypothetical protein|nr:FIST C-terminal domain-containing protein [Synergistaceae bacterium]
MKSTVAVSYEMDDMEKAAEELASQVLQSLTLLTYSCGLLFCDSEVDHDALAAALKEKLPMPVVGCSTIATFNGKKGFQDMNVSLIVLTADDVRFAVSLSEPLTAEGVKKQIEDAYSKGAAELEESPRLILAFPSYNASIMLDEYPETLDRLSVKAPIFGGIPGFVAGYGTSWVAFDGKAYTDRAVFILMGGNVHPLFSVKNVLKSYAEQKRLVTRAENNVVYKVGDISFIDHMRQLGMPVDKIVSSPDAISFVTSPLLLEMPKDEENDGFPFVRTLHTLNLEDGSGASIGRIPQGAVLSIVSMTRQDVDSSSKEAMRDLLEQIENKKKEGYECSTILTVSCIGRYMVIANDHTIEGRNIAEATPPSLNLSGFYSYGELCPTSMRDAKAANRAHNESIVFCAF